MRVETTTAVSGTTVMRIERNWRWRVLFTRGMDIMCDISRRGHEVVFCGRPVTRLFGIFSPREVEMLRYSDAAFARS